MGEEYTKKKVEKGAVEAQKILDTAWAIDLNPDDPKVFFRLKGINNLSMNDVDFSTLSPRERLHASKYLEIIFFNDRPKDTFIVNTGEFTVINDKSKKPLVGTGCEEDLSFCIAFQNKDTKDVSFGVFNSDYINNINIFSKIMIGAISNDINNIRTDIIFKSRNDNGYEKAKIIANLKLIGIVGINFIGGVPKIGIVYDPLRHNVSFDSYAVSRGLGGLAKSSNSDVEKNKLVFVFNH